MLIDNILIKAINLNDIQHQLPISWQFHTPNAHHLQVIFLYRKVIPHESRLQTKN